ncbi:U11/U12 small nuclear ribonucleoprotein 48 kDa protein-like [Phymastichus coffea]|uniref:U11/U12 small nuclear ribonucleoprotein 48 kDa protein-like n=1 Tax=Phymastichus coffea TaxID=108790 RepID=UPI00273C0AFE|nr:U11/U12 small nuclear ribonucleoprotein 48 kDa protein-like [Phymastichus coffea]
MEGIISEEKKKLIEELNKMISRADSVLKEVCGYYQWDIKDVEKVAEENYMICPFNKSHVVPEKSMHRHLESCEWSTLGYTKDCKPLPESAIPTDSPFTIKFDIELQFKVLQEAKQKNPQLNIGTDEKLIPKTSDRLTSDFTRDERKAIYEYVVAHTLAPDVGQDIADLNKPEKKEERSASLLELIAQERNLKRRKTRYRGVHTNKKSHLEIMREVVQQQMEMYKEYLAEKYGVQIPDEDPENSFNNIKDETRSSLHSEFSSFKSKSQDMNRESNRSRDHNTNYRESTKHHSYDLHRFHSNEYNDKSQESYKHYSRDLSNSSRHSSRYEDRDYKNHSKDSSRRHNYRDDVEYTSRNKYEDKNYSCKYSDKSQIDYTNTNKRCDKIKTIRDNNRDYNDSDKSCNDKDRSNLKRNLSSSIDKNSYPKSKTDTNSHMNDEKHENSYKTKKQKSSKSSKEKKHKKSKHKYKSRSRSRS